MREGAQRFATVFCLGVGAAEEGWWFLWEWTRRFARGGRRRGVVGGPGFARALQRQALFGGGRNVGEVVFDVQIAADIAQGFFGESHLAKVIAPGIFAGAAADEGLARD